MKKNLLIISAFILSISANAQWGSQATAFTTASRGIRNVCAVDANTVWVATYDGSGANANVQDFSRTIDGGVTWTPGTVTAPTTYNFSNIWAVNGTTAWAMFYEAVATTGGGGIFKTTDGGATWAQQGVGTIYGAGSFPDFLHFFDANNGFAVGDPNGPGTTFYEIYTTTDGGTTWTRTPSANIPAKKSATEYAIINLYEVKGNTIWFGTNEGRMYKSVDKGLNWTVSVVTATAGNAVSDVAFSDASNGISTIYNSGASTYSHYKTTDGGTTWSPLTVTSGTIFTADISAVPNNATYVSTGANTTIATGSSYSADGGATWVTIDTAVQHTAQGWVNNQIGWSGGFNTDAFTGGIFNYTGNALGVPALTRDNARMRLYPNPSNGPFTIQIGGAESKDARVTVVDIVGSVVYESTISNSSTVIEKRIDLTGISKGVYFVNVENGSTRFSSKITIK